VASTKRIDKRHVQRVIEVAMTNAKAMPVDLRLVQPADSSCRFEAESAKGIKLNAYARQWMVSVPAEGSAKLDYTVTMAG